MAPSGGAWRRGSRATGRSGAARPDKAPFISYMKGALLYSARPRSSGPGPTRRYQRQHLRQIMRPNDPGSTTSPQPAPPPGQVGMTSIFPPTATAASVAASHSRNQKSRGRPVSRLRSSPSLTRRAAAGRRGRRTTAGARRWRKRRRTELLPTCTGQRQTPGRRHGTVTTP